MLMNNITTSKEMPPHNYDITTDPPQTSSPLQCHCEVTSFFLSVSKRTSSGTPFPPDPFNKNQSQKMKPTFHKSG